MTDRKQKIESLFCEAPYQDFEIEVRGEQRGMDSIRHDWPSLFGQTPQALVRNPKIPAQAKALYCDYHTYSSPKELADSPDTYVSQERIARDMGWHYNTVSHYQKVLEEWGWITVKHRANKSNLIILHGRRRRIRSGKREG